MNDYILIVGKIVGEKIGVLVGCLLLVLLFSAPSFAVTSFTKPDQRALWITIRSSFLNWLRDNVLLQLLRDHPQGAPKFRNFLNVTLMGALDIDSETDPVNCCCDASQAPNECTMSAGPNCTVSPYLNRGPCSDLPPESTGYVYARDFSFDPWSITSDALGRYWNGMLDECLSIPMLDTVCFSMAISDIGTITGSELYFNTPAVTGWNGCGAILSDNAPVQGGCVANPYNTGKILDYTIVSGAGGNPNADLSINEFSSLACGFPDVAPASQWRVGYLEGYLQINNLVIPIDMVSPAPDALNFNTGTTAAPGATDCDSSAPGRQANCYIKAFARLRGNARLGFGATVYFQHRTNKTPHPEYVGISIAKIDIANSPWLTLQADWRWVESRTTSRRRKSSQYVSKLLEFIDLLVRGLFRREDIPTGLQRYFGPVVFDLTKTFQSGLSHIAGSYTRPISIDTIWYDASIGGPDIRYKYGLGTNTNILESLSCETSGGSSGPLALIADMAIDLEYFQKGSIGPPPGPNSYQMASCSYNTAMISAYASAGGGPSWPWSPTPTAGTHAPGQAAGMPQIAISISDNVFTRALSEVYTSGIMCLAVNKDSEGGIGGMVGAISPSLLNLIIPEAYSNLKDELGDNLEDARLILVVKPRYLAGAPPWPSCGSAGVVASGVPPSSSFLPWANTMADTAPLSTTPALTPGPSVDLYMCMPAVDVELWVNTQPGAIQQWTLANVNAAGNCPSFANCGVCAAPSCAVAPNGAACYRVNFPDSVSFIDCDTDAYIRERRFLAGLSVGVGIGIDLNIWGCGRNLIPGGGTTWWSSWIPGGGGPGATCSSPNAGSTPYLRRVELEMVLDPNVIAVARPQNYYYQYSGGTYFQFMADLLADILMGVAAVTGQIGFTLRPILDPSDALAPCDVVAFGNQACGVSGNSLGGATFVSRDSAAGVQSNFLSLYLTFQGKIHPDFLMGLLSGALGGEISLAPPVFNSKVDIPVLSQLANIDGVEWKGSVEDFMRILYLLQRYTIPDGNTERVNPPETEIVWIRPSFSKTTIKVSGWDAKTATKDLWYSYKLDNLPWSLQKTTDEIEIRKHLLPGKHTILVRAVNEKNLPDITPARIDFVIDELAPDVFFPKQSKFSQVVQITAKVWEDVWERESVRVQWKLDNGEWSDWIHPQRFEGVFAVYDFVFRANPGLHRLYIKTKDPSENQAIYVKSFEVSSQRAQGCF